MGKDNFMIPGIIALIIILIARAIGLSTTWSVILGLVGLGISYYWMNK